MLSIRRWMGACGGVNYISNLIDLWYQTALSCFKVIVFTFSLHLVILTLTYTFSKRAKICFCGELRNWLGIFNSEFHSMIWHLHRGRTRILHLSFSLLVIPTYIRFSVFGYRDKRIHRVVFFLVHHLLAGISRYPASEFRVIRWFSSEEILRQRFCSQFGPVPKSLFFKQNINP